VGWGGGGSAHSASVPSAHPAPLFTVSKPVPFPIPVLYSFLPANTRQEPLVPQTPHKSFKRRCSERICVIFFLLPECSDLNDTIVPGLPRSSPALSSRAADFCKRKTFSRWILERFLSGSFSSLPSGYSRFAFSSFFFPHERTLPRCSIKGPFCKDFVLAAMHYFPCHLRA